MTWEDQHCFANSELKGRGKLILQGGSSVYLAPGELCPFNSMALHWAAVPTGECGHRLTTANVGGPHQREPFGG